MPKIIFRKDINQDAQITDLYNTKVDLSAFNATVNDINTNITNLQNKHANDVQSLTDKINNDIQALKDNEIKSLQDAVNLLNADQNTEGSVEYKIKQAIDALINGAGDAYDTLKEIVDYINKEAGDLQDFINQVQSKVDALVDGASDDFNTLGKIETKINEINDEIDQLRGDTSDSLADVAAKIPMYKVDDELPINDGNKITLTYVPVGDLVNKQAIVYTTDNDGNRIVEGVYTVVHDSDDKTGKVYVIQADSQLSSDYKAQVSYFWNNADNPSTDSSSTSS